MFTVTMFRGAEHTEPTEVKNLGEFVTDAHVVKMESEGWVYYLRNEFGGLILTNDPRFLASNLPIDVWNDEQHHD